MPEAAAPLVIEMSGVVKDFKGLRPLRIQRLDVRKGDTVALVGLDQAMAEVLVNLITGAAVPDTGTVTVLGERTTDVTDGDAWFAALDRFGLITSRAAILEQFTAAQNLALPFSLAIDDMPADVRARVEALAGEVGLPGAELWQPAGSLSDESQLRVRLGRALAHDPAVLLAEHPNAFLAPDRTAVFAADVERIVARRGMTAVVVTADTAFARAIARQVLTLQPGTGVLKASGGWRQWFS